MSMNQLLGCTTFPTLADMARADVVGHEDERRFFHDAGVQPGQRGIAGLVVETGARGGDQGVELLIAEVAPVVRDRRKVLC